MPVYSETEQVGDADDGADVREVPMSDTIPGTTESTTSPMWDVSDAAFRAEPSSIARNSALLFLASAKRAIP